MVASVVVSPSLEQSRMFPVDDRAAFRQRRPLVRWFVHVFPHFKEKEKNTKEV